MRIDEHIEAVAAQGELLARVAGAADPDAPVPTCPGWTVRELVHHVGRVHRWATAQVRDALPGPLDEAGASAAWGAMPDDLSLIQWFRAGHNGLVAALSTAPPDLHCWSFLPAPSPLAFWARRQAHETAIHRADAESAAGALTDCAVDVALDGIDELLAGFFGRRSTRVRADPPVSLCLHATDASDGGGRWTVHIGPTGVSQTPATQPADCSIAGRASDIYYLLWNRCGTDRLRVQGDTGVLDLWRRLATVRWS
jgi:uncharacterized protein (TIGR03083 family)